MKVELTEEAVRGFINMGLASLPVFKGVFEGITIGIVGVIDPGGMLPLLVGVVGETTAGEDTLGGVVGLEGTFVLQRKKQPTNKYNFYSFSQ